MLMGPHGAEISQSDQLNTSLSLEAQVVYLFFRGFCHILPSVPCNMSSMRLRLSRVLANAANELPVKWHPNTCSQR
jgi:hypothetical protein